jgi:8-oxo-dGTP pyrophosphatase MutT (NUDIX family)
MADERFGDPTLASPASALRSEATTRQVGALPLRRRPDGGLDVLLVTSRETRRWVVPKGWPMKGLKDHRAAEQEAFEEAGVRGKIGKAPIGRFTYDKREANGRLTPIEVMLYRLDVRAEETAWPESRQRERRWCPVEGAAELVEEPELKLLLVALAAGAAA